MNYDHAWLLYLAAFAGAFAVTLAATPLAKRLSVRFGAIDQPKTRGMHTTPIPRMGGIAIVLGFMLTMLVLAFFLPDLQTLDFIGFMAGAAVIVTVGIFDDIYNLRARVKLAFQIIAALIVIFTGTQISFVAWPVAAHLELFSGPVTLLWIIGITNAVNLIDGVDGLAAGVSSIAALCLVVLCVLSGSPIAVVLSATLAGSCFGFLPRNFSPAEVFMGDTGALFLGFVLAVSSIMGVFKSYAVLSVVITGFALALPIFDTTFAMLRRAVRGKSIMAADRGHLHHRLIDAGLSPARAVLVLYGLSFLCGVIAIIIALNDIVVLLITVAFVLICWFMVFAYRKRVGNGKK